MSEEQLKAAKLEEEKDDELAKKRHKRNW